MSWFNKKKEEEESVDKAPELPEFDFQPLNTNSKSSLPNLDLSRSDDSSDLPELPSDFIKTSSSNNFQSNSEEKLPSLPERKSLVRSTPSKQMQRSPFTPINYPTEEPAQIRKLNPPNIGPRTMELPDLQPKSSTRETEPIYIRLDKFQTTSSAFEEIKRKVIEIESILNKTKEIKEKEQKELEEWERQVQIIKARMDAIDKSLFNKLD